MHFVVTMKMLCMKCLPAIFFIMLLVAACSKEHNNHADLLGVWVEKTNRLDTLVVTQDGNKIIMFDYSAYYRMAGRGIWPHDRYFKHQVLLKKDSIGFRPADASRMEPFFYYHFEWVVFKKEFIMSYNGLRPYLSSIGNLTFERVK